MQAKHEPSGVTTTLAAWASELTLAAMPAEVIAHLKTCLLDTIGCGLFGAQQPWGRAVSDVAIDLSGGARGASLFVLS